MRRSLRKMSDSTFVDVMKIFAIGDYCSPVILHALGRTPAIRERMKKVGFIPAPAEDSRSVYQQRPTRSREVLAKFKVEVRKNHKGRPPLARFVQIGTRQQNGREIKLDRAALFELIWSEPVETLAKRWGLSGRGLAKACQRLQIPVPPRGFWAKVQSGQRMRRPRLPELQPGDAEEIVIRAPQ